MLTHLFIFHILPTSLHLIFAQIRLLVLEVLICILFYDLCLPTRVFLQMMFSYVCPFWTLHLLWTRNKPLTELVLHNQHAMSFMKNMSGSLSTNTRWRMTPFRRSPLHSFLTSLVNLPSMVLHVCLHPWMHPFFITRRTRQMLTHHTTMERTNHSLKIHLIFHLPFPKTLRMSLLDILLCGLMCM